MPWWRTPTLFLFAAELRDSRTTNNLVQFITAGNALFTLENTATGNRFTFRVRQPGDDKPHFVSVLTGADNESDYTFLGTIFEGLRLSARAAVSDCSYCPERAGD